MTYFRLLTQGLQVSATLSSEYAAAYGNWGFTPSPSGLRTYLTKLLNRESGLCFAKPSCKFLRAEVLRLDGDLRQVAADDPRRGLGVGFDELLRSSRPKTQLRTVKRSRCVETCGP